MAKNELNGDVITRQTPAEETVVKYFDELSNWGRWGHDDEAGTLNLITAESKAKAARLVRDGVSVSCSRMLAPRPSRWVGFEYTHRMNSSGEAAPDEGPGTASDWFGLSFHGYEHTHLDSHSHIFWNGQMYNGRSAALCTTARGALAGGVDPALGGIISRGLLIDGPQIRGKGWLDPGEALYPDELDAWLALQSLSAEPGDVLWVRTGRDVADQAGHGYDQGADGSPGLSPTCLPWLRDKDISVLISDIANDVRPSQCERLGNPIHVIGIVAMGMWLVDNAQLEPLLRECRRTGRYEFMSLIIPLALRRSTGSPVNPVAVF
jgi:kynurenine formamidase